MKFYYPYNASTENIDIKGDVYPIQEQVEPVLKIGEAWDGTLIVYDTGLRRRFQVLRFANLTKADRDALRDFIENTVGYGNEFAFKRAYDGTIRTRARLIGGWQERETSYQKYEVSLRVRITGTYTEVPP